MVFQHSPNIQGARPRHLTLMGKIKDAFSVLVGKPEEKRKLAMSKQR
jgi:hypothetical protein